MNDSFVVAGKLVDVFNRKTFNAQVSVVNGKIEKITEIGQEQSNYIIPGFVDSHVHIESSMMVPSSFARAAVKHGTVATVSDPHEIANVLGIAGVEYMIQNSKKVPFKFFFGAPSCVPATSFETSGAVINSSDIEKLLNNPDIYYLAEMMNFPGVIFNDKEVHSKMNAAYKVNKPIDGHAPGLSGPDLKKYASAGITTDHECSTLDEAVEKINCGIKVQIREGSAAKDFENLFPLINSYPEKTMLCTDDCHPNDLINGHINKIAGRAIRKGANIYDVLTVAIKNPVEHYNLNVGLLRSGDAADFIIVKDLVDFDVIKTYINGCLVFDNGEVFINQVNEAPVNNFNCSKISEKDIFIPESKGKVNVIVAKDGDLLTKKIVTEPKMHNGNVVADVERDILKIVIVNRYKNEIPVVGLIKNFNLKSGAIAGSIAHDSHNIIAIGTTDNDIVKAINTVIENKGGIVACDSKQIVDLKLNVAGLMSTEQAEEVAAKYEKVNTQAKMMGSTLTAPFMTMAFMALLVIPELKIGDKGLFDVSKFQFTSLFTE
ncbi:MAG: adenine deaminase [Bacteroidetes bacterium GWC2_33_15]|nr:MAG: adenine deaminase [Bacteroidetes bacterium GWA2_33_15]OFX50825.1 MAG: adenine deaminase [Bacteroidetes bacterium GWC2_33_15]OFX62892.1 MAG: adenine deaminase [Bacteroidetes bacterium GWB2_32_14]OFX69962.1 MAG: adenine deaminase [Bacteroidetes bacterium GWD2_33_33]HAN18957.1 adenine deaminase [Bacteroidales bacterium]